jgi:hypothetical protein
MSINRIVVSATVAFTILFVAASDSLSDSLTEQERDEEIQLLREANEMMREQLREQEKRLAALEARDSSRDSTRMASVDSGPPLVERGDGLQAVVSGVPIKLTGFMKGDMLWNNSRLDSTSAPRLSAPGNQGSSDDQFTATVQHSRVTATIGPIPVSNSTLGGMVELDYFNLSDSGDTNFNNNQLRVRHLFMNVAHGDWTILAGQTSDIVSPLNPTSLNTNGNYWFGGNGGFRRPQLQVTRKFELAEDSPLTLKGSVNANIGATTMPGGVTYNSGRKAGWPVFEAAIEQGLGGFGAGPIRMGIAGSYGEEDLVGVKNHIDQWMIGGYLMMPIFEWLTLTGEIQHGENADAFLMGGGINAAGGSIASTSGWLQATLTPMERWEFNMIFGFDDPKDSNVDAMAMEQNLVAGASARFKIFEPLTFGFEYTYFDTDYKDLSNGNAHMIWTSMIFNY